MKISDDFRYELTRYKAQGGKKSRKEQVNRVYLFLEYCAKQYNIKAPDQIGRKQVYCWLSESKTDSQRRDRYYAVVLLWKMLGRGKPTFVSYKSD